MFQAQFLKCMMPETDAERQVREAAGAVARDQAAGVQFPRIVLAGLRNFDLNGRMGIRGPLDTAKGRFLVKLDDNGALVNVRPENIWSVGGGEGTADAEAAAAAARMVPPEKERGVVILPSTSTILQMSVFMILKDRLQQLVVREASARGAWFVVLYVLWTLTGSRSWAAADSAGSAGDYEFDDALDATLMSSASAGTALLPVLFRWASWALIPGFLFATFQDSPECRQVRAQFSRFCDTTLCHDRSFPHSHMEFTSDSYLAAAMLLLMAKARLDYLVIVYVVAWPQALLWIERCSKSASANDKKCLVRMRTALLWLNKFVLLFKAWYVSWAGMFAVCAVSFPTLSKILLDLAIMVFFMGLAAVSKGMAVVAQKLPAARALAAWAQRSQAHHFPPVPTAPLGCPRPPGADGPEPLWIHPRPTWPVVPSQPPVYAARAGKPRPLGLLPELLGKISTINYLEM